MRDGIGVVVEQAHVCLVHRQEAILLLDDVAQVQLNRRIAAAQHLDATEILYSQAEESQKGILLDQLLDAQTRLADSETQYGRSLIEYMMAIKQVHNAKGSLLNYNQVWISEGAWPAKAHQDAADRESRRIKS